MAIANEFAPTNTWSDLPLIPAHHLGEGLCGRGFSPEGAAFILIAAQ